MKQYSLISLVWFLNIFLVTTFVTNTLIAKEQLQTNKHKLTQIELENYTTINKMYSSLNMYIKEPISKDEFLYIMKNSYNPWDNTREIALRSNTYTFKLYVYEKVQRQKKLYHQIQANYGKIEKDYNQLVYKHKLTAFIFNYKTVNTYNAF